MAWVEVTVTHGKKELPAMQRGADLHLVNKIGKPTSVVVDGKTIKVESYTVDERDDIIQVKLDLPKGRSKGASDDQSPEG